MHNHTYQTTPHNTPHNTPQFVYAVRNKYYHKQQPHKHNQLSRRNSFEVRNAHDKNSDRRCIPSTALMGASEASDGGENISAAQAPTSAKFQKRRSSPIGTGKSVAEALTCFFWSIAMISYSVSAGAWKYSRSCRIQKRNIG
jgi:hypothetical protein